MGGKFFLFHFHALNTRKKNLILMFCDQNIINIMDLLVWIIIREEFLLLAYFTFFFILQGVHNNSRVCSCLSHYTVIVLHSCSIRVRVQNKTSSLVRAAFNGFQKWEKEKRTNTRKNTLTRFLVFAFIPYRQHEYT